MHGRIILAVYFMALAVVNVLANVCMLNTCESFTARTFAAPGRSTAISAQLTPNSETGNRHPNHLGDRRRLPVLPIRWLPVCLAWLCC